MAPDLAGPAQAIELLGAADAAARPLDAVLGNLVERFPAAAAALQGEWLGHAVHPMLTDLPIGFWTSAWVLDLIGGRRAQPTADLLIALGVLTAVPTVAAGAADYVQLPKEKQRVGVVHAASNAVATTLYAASWVSRRRGRRGTGLVLSNLGAAVATVGGYLGGHLVFGEDAADAEDAPDAEVPIFPAGFEDSPSLAGL